MITVKPLNTYNHDCSAQWMDLMANGMGFSGRDASECRLLSDIANRTASALSVGSESRGFLPTCSVHAGAEDGRDVSLLLVAVEHCYFLLVFLLLFST